MAKLIFVDFDNVLFTTNFGPKGCGMHLDEWMEWCVNKKEHSYDTCSPVAFIQDYLWANMTERRFVLTAVASSYEADAKRYKVEECYRGSFEEFIAVGTAKDKLKIIKAVAEREEVPLSDCTLIEDDYNLLLEANEMGIKAVHVTEIANMMYENVFFEERNKFYQKNKKNTPTSKVVESNEIVGVGVRRVKDASVSFTKPPLQV